MRDLGRRHAETHELHAAAMARWEELDARLGELKGTISGLRS
jgi:hypothetical protein